MYPVAILVVAHATGAILWWVDIPFLREHWGHGPDRSEPNRLFASRRLAERAEFKCRSAAESGWCRGDATAR